MGPRSRRKRAILRDRRRGWHGIVPLLGPLTGYDLYLINRYYQNPPKSPELAPLWGFMRTQVEMVAALVAPPGHKAEAVSIMRRVMDHYDPTQQERTDR